MTDLFAAASAPLPTHPAEPPPPRKRVRPAIDRDAAIAEAIARAVFPLSWSESPVILNEVARCMSIEVHRKFQIERCRPAVQALRDRGLLAG